MPYTTHQWKPVDGPIFFISRQMKPTESRYGAGQMAYLFLLCEWVSQEPEKNIEEISVTEIGTELFNKFRESYKVDKNCHILCQLLRKYLKYPPLSPKSDELWKKAYHEDRFSLLDNILYHRTKNTSVMILTDRALIDNTLHELDDSFISVNLSEGRIL
ncbi:hypothetical protein O181_056972 [Austropuccinia psidii MF-1]|uniref:Uncharacterized protein n=1 Tax=Austropuccinia psidii MF-1 TaxID=1389203 RepID=A0A9Q3HUZ3_9BASI|nr:hypothetical protein [Austropuccinia psidii MF-1]